MRPASISYVCPHCHEAIFYETDSVPTNSECHRCLKPLKINYEYF